MGPTHASSCFLSTCGQTRARSTAVFPASLVRGAPKCYGAPTTDLRRAACDGNRGGNLNAEMGHKFDAGRAARTLVPPVRIASSSGRQDDMRHAEPVAAAQHR